MYKIAIALSMLLLLPLTLPAQDTRPDDYVERMEREHANDRPLASPAAAVAPVGEVATETVAYGSIDGREIHGFLARPAGTEPAAGILVIHEWWGLNDNIRSMARQLAGEGYAALAVDLYEGKVAETRDEAARLARASGEAPDRGRDNLRQAWRYLKEERGLGKVGVIGWCFGGGWSLETALLLGEGIDAVVIYYGRVSTDREVLAALAAPVLGIFGVLDQGIPVATVREFQVALDGLGKTASIHVYEDADHAFANPSGTRYNEKAASDAWRKTLQFFDQTLR